MTSRRTAWLLAALFWALFGLISGAQVWISMRSHGHSVALLVAYYLLVWEAYLLPSVFIVWLARRVPVLPPKGTSLAIHAFGAMAVALVHELYWTWLLLTLRPFDQMNPSRKNLDFPKNLLEGLPLEIVVYGLVLGCTVAFDYYERYRERALQAAELEASLTDARLHALELQIQPHFLFNTMNAITSLVRTNRNDEAIAMISGLSDLLRYTLDHAGEQRVALEDEVAVLRRYLEIQHVRFPDRMSFQIDVSPDVRRGAVPTLLLQPLAENAVRHGIAPRAAHGVIEIRAFREEDRMKIDVFNSGTLSAGSPRGIGLTNTLARLRHLYGDAWRFDLTSANGGVLASVSFPFSEVT